MVEIINQWAEFPDKTGSGSGLNDVTPISAKKKIEVNLDSDDNKIRVQGNPLLPKKGGVTLPPGTLKSLAEEADAVKRKKK